MKVRSLLALVTGLLAGMSSTGFAATTFTWTGTSLLPYFNEAGNWAGGTAPSSSSTNTALVFSSIGSTANSYIVVNTSLDVNSIAFSGAFPAYQLASEGGYTFGIGSGGITVGSSGSSSGVILGANLQLLANQTWNVDGRLSINAGISGSFTLTKTGTGTLILGQNGTTNFSGGLYVQQGTLLLASSSASEGSTVFSGPVGTGQLRLGATSTLAAANNFGISLGNAILLESGATFGQSGSSNGLTLTGAISFQNPSTTINVLGSGAIDFATPLVDTSPTAAVSLAFTGGGLAKLSGSNTYTGGTTVNGGRLQFDAAGAIPASGSISASNNGHVGVSFNGGLGMVVNKIGTPGTFAGSLGLDSATTFTDSLTFTSFSSANFVGVGTYSTATFSGSITPVGSGDYKFGGGNGTLSVTTNLAASGAAGVTVSSPVTYVEDQRLTVFLRGANTFSGNVNVSGSNLIFDAASALPTGANFTLGAYGYIGYTATPTNIANFAAFKSRLSSYTGTSVIGIDSASRLSPRTISEAITLSSTSPLYLGTSTSVYLDATSSLSLTPGAGTLYLTGVNGGYLKVGPALLSTNNISALKVGYANSSAPFGYDSFVELDHGSSTYSGGTTLESGYLLLGASSSKPSTFIVSGPIGTGTLTVPSYAHSPALSAITAVTLHNPIVLNSNLFVGTNFTTNYPTNADFPITLSGDISGSGGLSYATNSDSALTLNGANTFSGGFTGSFGSVNANHNTALGSGLVNLDSTSVFFSTSAPSIGGITGSFGALVLSNSNATLQINQQQAGSYGGEISGTNITVTKTGSASLTLSGYSGYTGTTNVNQGKLIIDSSSDGSYGPLGGSTVSLGGGELQVINGNSINNSIVFSAPSRLTGTGGFNAAMTIGTNATIAPGSSPGLMSFNNVTFASGGAYEIEVQSASGTLGSGYDSLSISGTLNFTSTSGSPFRLDLISLSTSGALGNVSDFSAANSYQWIVAVASGGITGFSPSIVTVNSAGFSNALSGGTFSVSATSNTLLVNFSPVPEPSTWALLALGLGGIAVSIIRRRKSAR